MAANPPNPVTPPPATPNPGGGIGGAPASGRLQPIALGLLLAAMLWFSYYSAHPQRAWLFTLGLLAALLVLLGIWIMKMPLGILVSNLNLMSLSRLQLAGWTAVIFSGYLVILMQRILHQIPDPLAITVDNNVWAVLGISMASFVGAPLVLGQKTQNNLPSQATQKAATALKEDASAIQKNAQGTVYANEKASDARITDMFEGDEVGNTAYVDISKVQMFLLTVFLVVAYASDLWHLLGGYDSSIVHGSFAGLDHLPKFSPGEVQLLGASHAGYLSFKAVSHTPTTNN